jgi:arylsulfatase A-like enzyme
MIRKKDSNPKTSGIRTNEREMAEAKEMIERPHVILITMDCVRWDHIFGEAVHTPHIARFAEDAISFKRAYSQANVTLPALYSLLCSEFPNTHQIYHNFTLKKLPDHSLPSVLKGKAWKVGAFFGALFITRILGQEFDNKGYGGRLPTMRVPILRRYFARINAEILVNQASRWLWKNAQDSSCFLWIHFFDTHMPYQAPQEFVSAYYPVKGTEGKGERSVNNQLKDLHFFTPVPSMLNGITDIHYFPSLYKAAVAYVDRELGRFFKTLQEMRIYDQSFIILLSDHGENLIDHGIYCGHQKLYDTTIRIPLIIKDFSQHHRGDRIDALVQQIDISPTILERLGFDAKGGEGKSLFPLIALKAESLHDAVVSEHVMNLRRSIRTKEWLLVKNMEEKEWRVPPGTKRGWNPKDIGDPEIVLMRASDGENGRNLSSEKEDVVAELSKKMESILGAKGRLVAPDEKLDKDLIKQLKSLGYLT